MKKIMSAILIGCLVFTASTVYAGSVVKGKVVNKVVIKNSKNLAKGENQVALMGVTDIHNSRVDGKIMNRARINKTMNSVTGKNNIGTVGTTWVTKSVVKGTLVNDVRVDNSKNIVHANGGQGSRAEMATIRIR